MKILATSIWIVLMLFMSNGQACSLDLSSPELKPALDRFSAIVETAINAMPLLTSHSVTVVSMGKVDTHMILDYYLSIEGITLSNGVKLTFAGYDSSSDTQDPVLAIAAITVNASYDEFGRLTTPAHCAIRLVANLHTTSDIENTDTIDKIGSVYLPAEALRSVEGIY